MYELILILFFSELYWLLSTMPLQPCLRGDSSVDMPFSPGDRPEREGCPAGALLIHWASFEDMWQWMTQHLVALKLGEEGARRTGTVYGTDKFLVTRMFLSHIRVQDTKKDN